MRRTSARLGSIAGRSRSFAQFSFPLKLGALLLVCGFILDFLDPSFDPADRDGWLLILALALSAGLVGLSDDLAQYWYLRRRGHHAIVRLHGGNLVLVVVTTVFSRMSRLTPGILIGSPAGIEEVNDPEFETKSHILGISAIASVALVAGIAGPMAQGDAWISTLLLLIFGTAVQTLFFEMLPLKYLHGRGILASSRILWLLVFAATTAVFLQTMLNPDGAFAAAFNSPNMVTLTLIVSAFCIFATIVWFSLQQLEKMEAARAVSPEGD